MILKTFFRNARSHGKYVCRVSFTAVEMGFKNLVFSFFFQKTFKTTKVEILGF